MSDKLGMIDGKFRMRDNATVWDDNQGAAFTAVAITGGGISDPPFDFLVDDGAGSQGIYCYQFTNGTDETIFMSAQMSHSWKFGTNLQPHVHWMPTTTDTGFVRWQFEYTVIPYNTTMGATTTLTSVDDAGDGTAYKHQIASLPEIDMSGIASVSPIILIRLMRDGNNDTYADPAALLYVDFHYQRDDMGSAEPFVKG